MLFGGVIDEVLLRLPNVLHDNSLFAVADNCQTLTIWHLCGAKLSMLVFFLVESVLENFSKNDSNISRH